MRTINQDYKKMCPTKLTDFGADVEAAIVNHPNLFPAPVPAISTMATTRIALCLAIAKAKDGSLVDRQNRDALTEEYRAMIIRLARYVQMQADGNDNVLELSGFNLSRIRKRIGQLDMVRSVQFKPSGYAACLALKWGAVYDAKSYLIEFSETDSDKSYSKVSLTTKMLLHFPKGRTEYNVRIAAVGAAGLGPWSPSRIMFVV